MNAIEYSSLVYFCGAMETIADNPAKRQDLISLALKKFPASKDFIQFVNRFDGLPNEEIITVSKQIREEIK